MRHLRSTLALALAAGAAACADGGITGARAPHAAPLLAARGPAVEGSWIVVLNQGASPRAVAAAAGAEPRFVYSAVVNGFAATLNAGQLNALRHDPAVAYVEQDGVARATSTQTSAPWHLDRIDQANLPLDGLYHYTATGSSVRAYIIDTGLQANHPQFGARAQNVYDYAGGSGADCNGHGTHVGGIVGSTTYGVAKAVQLRGVRVLDCSGSGSFSAIIAGLDWVRLNAVKPAVANLSLGGGVNATFNTAVTSLWNSGVFVAAASGNENQDACNTSPASAAGVYIAAGVNADNSRLSTGNWGPCVDIYAPGGSITSTWLNGGTATLTGGSMAAPGVAGVAVLYLATFGNQSAPTVASWITSHATVGVVTGIPAGTGTPNRLLNKSTL